MLYPSGDAHAATYIATYIDKYIGSPDKVGQVWVMFFFSTGSVVYPVGDASTTNTCILYPIPIYYTTYCMTTLQSWSMVSSCQNSVSVHDILCALHEYCMHIIHLMHSSRSTRHMNVHAHEKDGKLAWWPDSQFLGEGCQNYPILSDVSPCIWVAFSKNVGKITS